jgi:hypothetical protein
MAFGNPHINDSVWKLLLENFSHLTRSEICITGYDPRVLSGQLNQCPIVSGVHVLMNVSSLS